MDQYLQAKNQQSKKNRSNQSKPHNMMRMNMASEEHKKTRPKSRSRQRRLKLSRIKMHSTNQLLKNNWMMMGCLRRKMLAMEMNS
jgi:hypothetical protein